MEITIAPMVKPEVADAPYFLKILDHIKNKLSNNYHFIIARSNNEEEKQQLYSSIKKNKKNILIFLSDEKGIIPPFLEEFEYVFRTYSNTDLYDNQKIFAVPCGFSFGYGGYFGNSDWVYKDAEKIKKPLTERKYDFFYSAQFSQNRIKCVENLNKIKNNFNGIINVTDGFAHGYNLEDYYSLMSDSKICIVPDGAVVPESFRYFESFENNCIVITTYPINNNFYKNWFYNDSPAIFLNDWNDLNKSVIENLLSENVLKKYEDKNRKYFEKSISTKAVASYIYKIIN